MTTGAGRERDAPKSPPELFEAAFKPVLEKTQELWAQVVGQAPGSEQLRRTFQEQLGRYLQAMNLPTRGDVEAIQRELGALEARVRRLEARPAARRPPRAPKRSLGRARRGAGARRGA